MNNKIDIAHLTLDIEHDKKKILKCESCEFMMSTLLYVVQTQKVTGIFHICDQCGEYLKKIKGVEFLLINKASDI